MAEEVPIDVCAEAEVTFSAERQLRESELRGSAEGEQLLKAHLDALRTAYPDYYTESNCRARSFLWVQLKFSFFFAQRHI